MEFTTPFLSVLFSSSEDSHFFESFSIFNCLFHISIVSNGFMLISLSWLLEIGCNLYSFSNFKSFSVRNFYFKILKNHKLLFHRFAELVHSFKFFTFFSHFLRSQLPFCKWQTILRFTLPWKFRVFLCFIFHFLTRSPIYSSFLSSPIFHSVSKFRTESSFSFLTFKLFYVFYFRLTFFEILSILFHIVKQFSSSLASNHFKIR